MEIKTLNGEMKAKNFAFFCEKMKEFGVSEDKINEVFGNKLENATYAIDTKSNVAVGGSLLHVVLRGLTPIALKLNEILSPQIQLAKENIVKVCLLQHLAKAFMFEPNDNKWEIEHGKPYRYTPTTHALRLGARSVAVASRLGMTLDESDIEALLSIDKDVNDEQAKYYTSPLALIIRQANEILNMQNMLGIQ